MVWLIIENKNMIKFNFPGQINFAKDNNNKKRKSLTPYLIPAVAGGVSSLGGKTIKGKLVRGLGGAALAGGAMLGAKKLDEANNSGKIRDLGSKVGLNNYKKKKRK